MARIVNGDVFPSYDSLMENLNAIEQAILDVCDIETVHAIKDRARVLRKK